MTEPKKPTPRKPRAKKAAETPVNGPVSPIEGIAEPVAPRTLTVRAGDSWWSLAARSLDVPNTMLNYASIELEKRRLQPLNPEATLLAGSTINLD